MGTTITLAQRDSFYRAAFLGLRALDELESTARRFGTDADARWEGFRGHLGATERLDLLIRDAAVRWGSGFSPATVFGLPGLASDEPFGPDWASLPEHDAHRLWSDLNRPAGIDAVAEALGMTASHVDLPTISASTRLVVAGGAAIRAVAIRFQGSAELSWSDQVLVVAKKPAFRQLAGLMAPLLGAREPTRLVRPEEDVAGALKAVGFNVGGQGITSDDADGFSTSFVRLATRGG